MRHIDLTGQTFGRLTALEYKGNGKWLCQCQCGNTIEALIGNLKSGHTQSCGCLKNKASSHIGEKFGSLTVKEVKYFKTSDDGKGYTKCRCICDCGRTKTLRLDSLLAGHTTTCGQCKVEEYKEKRVKALKNKEFLQGTQVGKIKFDKKPIKTNKSGVTGVNWDKTRGKWMAGIRFQGKKYNLGRFENIADAISARKEAEKAIFGSFIKWYTKFKKED